MTCRYAFKHGRFTMRFKGSNVDGTVPSFYLYSESDR